MKRRQFMTLLGGAAAWPMAARAQQPAMPVVGFLGISAPDTIGDRLRAFRLGLKEAGYIDGENLAIDYRWTENQFDRFPELATDFVRKRVAVITTIAGAYWQPNWQPPRSQLSSSPPKTRSGSVLSPALPGPAAT